MQVYSAQPQLSFGRKRTPVYGELVEQAASQKMTVPQRVQVFTAVAKEGTKRVVRPVVSTVTGAVAPPTLLIGTLAATSQGGEDSLGRAIAASILAGPVTITGAAVGLLTGLLLNRSARRKLAAFLEYISTK